MKRVLRSRLRTESIVTAASVALICTVVIYPIIRLLVDSFKIETTGHEVLYTFSNYVDVFTSQFMVEALRNTLIIAGCTSIFAGIIGTLLAWIAARTNCPWKGILEPLNLVPFFLSSFIGALAWKILASPQIGLLNKFLISVFRLSAPPLNIYSLPGIIWVMTLFYTPYMYLFTVGNLRQMDPALEESARVSGTNIFHTTVRITLPLATPAILSGILLTFVTSAGIFGVPLILGAPSHIRTLSTQIYNYMSLYPPNYGMGAATAGILLLISLVGIAIQRKIILPRSFTTITGTGFRPSIINLGKWRYAALAVNLVFIFFAVFLPLLALFLSSISRVWLGAFHLSEVTARYFYYVLFEYELTRVALRNSLLLGSLGGFITVVLCIIISYIIFRTKAVGRGILDYASTVPIGVPGIVMGMAILIAWIKTPLYGTIWIIMLAYMTRYIPFAIKAISSVLLSVHPELEESSRTCGASWLRTIKSITVPLIQPGVAAAWMMLFIMFIRELAASVLLWTEGSVVMAVALVILDEQAPLGALSAFAMVQVAILLGVIYGFRKIIGVQSVSF